MPAQPKVGLRYRQEYYKGHAEDKAPIMSLEEQVEVPFGHFGGRPDDEGPEPARAEDPRVQVLRSRGRAGARGRVSGGSDREELLRFRRGK